MVLQQKPAADSKTYHVFRRGNPLDRAQIVEPISLHLGFDGARCLRHAPTS